MSLPRFHVPEAAAGARVRLPEHSAHHAREVLRLRAGAAVRVFDGAGGEFDGVLEAVTRQGVVAHLAGPVAPCPEPELRIVLALSPLKGDRMELAVQKATELGVAEIWPVVTARTDAAARPALRGTRQDRWEKVMSGAAEQSRRAVVPLLLPTRPLAELLAAPFDGARLLFHERPGEPALSALPRPKDAVLALVGPAGGFEPSEVARARDVGFATVSLGPRVLRAETAAMVGVTALQVLWGDLA